MIQMINMQIFLFGLLSTINGFDLQCPHPSQRTARIQSVCSGNSSAYTCLYDTIKKGYVEFCSNRKDNFVRAGLKYVISGTYRNVRCSDGRYQPVRFWSNQSSVCMNLKSECNGFGETVYNNRSSIYDATCRCDYTRGYAFVSKPRNNCFCIPLEEDCSCYIKECSKNTTLSPDYECNYIGLMKESFYCEHVIKRQKHGNGTDMPVLFEDNNQWESWERPGRIGLAGFILGFTVISVILVVMYVIYDKISEDQRDLKHDNGKKIESDNRHAHNLNIKSQSNEAFPTPNDNSSLSESDINVIRKHNYIENNSLLSACRKGDLSKVNSLIDRGADINITDKDGNTPISWACYGGNIDIVNLLIGKGCDINKPDNNGKTPLNVACHRGHLQIVARLIERDADISTADKYGNTPLSLSCTYGFIDVVDLLIDKGCDINKPDKDGMTPLMEACYRRHLPIVVRLIEKGADMNTADKNGETALSLASKDGNNDIVKLLLDKVSTEPKPNVDRKPQLTKDSENEDIVIEKGLDIQAHELNVADKKQEENKQYRSVPCYEISSNPVIPISNVTSKAPVSRANSLTQSDVCNVSSLLIKACMEGKLDSVRSLISKVKDINFANEEEQTSLFWSCFGGYIDIVNLLIKTECDVHKSDKNGRTPLMIACSQGNVSTVERFIEEGTRSYIDTDYEGQTPFFWSCLGGNVDIVKLMIGIGHDLDRPNNKGKTPLMAACFKGHLQVVHVLLENGARIDCEDNDQQTPLFWSCAGDNIDIVNLLIANNCTIDQTNSNGCTPLMEACGKGHLSIVRLLIQKAAGIHITDHKGQTPFYWSCIGSNIDVVRLLIDEGCDIHKSNINGFSPLFEACIRHNEKIAELLTSNGYFVSGIDRSNHTPLQIAYMFAKSDSSSKV